MDIQHPTRRDILRLGMLTSGLLFAARAQDAIAGEAGALFMQRATPTSTPTPPAEIPFDVLLVAPGAAEKRWNVLSALYELTNRTLHQCLDLVNNPPSLILRGVSETLATNAKQLLESAGATVEIKQTPFLMPVEDVFGIKGRGTVVTGRIERGKVKVGEEVEIVGLKETRKTVVTEVEMFRKILTEGIAGDNVGCLLRGIEREDVERGQVLAKPGSITPHTKFQSEVYMLKNEEGGRHTPFFNGYRPQFYIRTIDVIGEVTLDESQCTARSSVLLTAVGANKIEVIKVMRLLTNLGLKEAKDLVDSAPTIVLAGVDQREAEAAVSALAQAGATVKMYSDAEMVPPGTLTNVTVELIVPIALEAGTRFAVREGGRTVGLGVVTKIIE